MTATNDSSSARRRTLNSPGLTARSHRIAELQHLLRLEEAKEQPHATPAQINEKAGVRLRKLTAQRPGVIKQFKRYAQTSFAPNRRDINPWVELAAALNEPEMREVMSRLQSHSRGRRTDRREALAALTVLAGVPSSTSICHTTTMLRDAPIARWVFGDPPRLSRSSIYELVHGIAERHDPALAVQANLSLLKRLGERHPRIGTVAVVDGSKIEAHVVQRSPIDERHRQLLHNGRQRNVKSFKYTGKGDNHITDFWVGYKLMLLADRASGLPLTWNFDGADERTGSRGLLDALFTHWPYAPLEYLVGDGLYGRDRQYLHDLEFRWGVHPVFPLVETDISPAMPHAKTRGVPECRHGLMKRRDHDGYTTPEHRRQQGIPRNHLVDDHARIRYICAVGDPECPRQSVYTRDDGRLYPYLPHDGREGDQCFDRRQALLLGRNSIEMRFAHLKGGGVGNTGQARFKMRSDRVSEWLISLNLLLASAKRVAHETGHYEETLDDARSLRLID
jgi:hypothetical protein